MDAQRPRGDLRGDARVAVAVAADPRARSQERPDPRRARPRPAAVGGRPARPTGRRVERRVERAVQPRDDAEQRRVEERHRGPHLVERRRAHDAQVGGPPQQRDLLAQSAPDVAILRGRQARVVEPREQHRAPAEREERRPPARLGRMGREDRGDRQAPDERVELGVRSSEPAQAGDGVGDRVVEDPVARGPLAATQGAHPCARLGQVDQPEVQPERADHGLGGVEVEGAQLVVQPGALERVVVAAQRDRPAADALDQGEQLRPGLLRDHLPEQRAEQPDLDGQAGRARPTCRSRAARRRPRRDARDGLAGLMAARRLDRSAPQSPPHRNLAGRNHSVGLYRDARDDRPSPRPTPPAPACRAPRRAAGAALPTSSSSCASSTRSRAWRRRPGRGTSCSRPSSTGPAMCSTPTSPRCTCSTATERT